MSSVNSLPKPGPRLQALLDSGVAYKSDLGNYLAVAADARCCTGVSPQVLLVTRLNATCKITLVQRIGELAVTEGWQRWQPLENCWLSTTV